MSTYDPSLKHQHTTAASRSFTTVRAIVLLEIECGVNRLGDPRFLLIQQPTNL